MHVIETDLQGVVILEPQIFGDHRGYFFESFSQREFAEKVCETVFVRTTNRNRAMEYYADCIINCRPTHRASWCG